MYPISVNAIANARSTAATSTERDRATQQEMEKSIAAATAKVAVLQDLIEVEEGRLEQEI